MTPPARRCSTRSAKATSKEVAYGAALLLIFTLVLAISLVQRRLTRVGMTMATYTVPTVIDIPGWVQRSRRSTR